VALGGTFDDAGMNRLRGLADHAAAAWREPDHGIWEMRSEPREHVHGKIMSWVALDRAMRLFPAEADRWREAREAIVHEVRRRGIDPEGGYLLQALDHPGTTDAAVLVAPAVGYPLEEETLVRTVEAIGAQLRRGDYVRRYVDDDGLSGEEGGFLLCSFWLIDAYLALGREREARAMYERLLADANDVGLYAEQIDPENRGLLGNFPQAFTHLGLIGSAINLELFAAGGRDALTGGHAERARRRLP
jgi:GH15 family glucan-1,4-alpha-glucosidase